MTGRRNDAAIFNVRTCIGRADDLVADKSYYIVEVEAGLGTDASECAGGAAFVSVRRIVSPASLSWRVVDLVGPMMASFPIALVARGLRFCLMAPASRWWR